jgi:rhamnulokinase
VSPKAPKSHLAFDLGASASRALLGTLHGHELEMSELHRFTTPILEVGGHLFWDVAAMWTEIEAGFEAAKQAAPDLRSVSVDSWAVDYVSLDASGAAVGNPFCYRDTRTEGVMQRAFGTVPADEIYGVTGIQFLPFNTLYQLLAEARDERREPPVLHLPIADYFNYRLSGRRAVEVSMASTTQFMDVHSKQWAVPLMKRFGLDPSRWPEIVPSGTRLGATLTGPGVEVVATCSHDTGSAVAAAPATDRAGRWLFISSGTWSLMGAERATPLLTDDAHEAGFTNEAGLDGTIRFLKNLTGLWVLQECVREWGGTGPVAWADLEREARAVTSTERAPDDTMLDLEDAVFLPRGPMEERIHAYCREHGMGTLGSRGAMALAILSSIAASYRRTLDELERVTGTTYDRVHLFGGGSQNVLLCELTARACEREVVAGPVEATAMGNLLIQARVMGSLPADATIRDVAAASSTLRVYSPHHST